MRRLGSIKVRASGRRRDVVALYLPARDPRVPWYAKAVALVVAAYAVSPIDLIPRGFMDEVRTGKGQAAFGNLPSG
jgi:uncharacterized membrane protein YkvA (DUF1232 family)